MEKLKQNRIWLTIIVIGVIVITILLAMLHQQKENSPAAQSSSYASSMKAASESTVVQDKDNQKAYAKKAAKMNGHVFKGHITTWSQQDFVNWANDYVKKPFSIDSQTSDKESFGTTSEFGDSDVPGQSINTFANEIHQSGTVDSYYDTVKDFNHYNPNINPDDIQK